MYFRRKADKLKITILLSFVLIYGFFLYVNTQNKNARIDLALENQIKDLNIHYNLTKNYFIKAAKAAKLNIIDNDKTIDIFLRAKNSNELQKEILREKLYQQLLPLYNRMLIKGILQFQFVFPDNISFLRMHKRDKFGDNLENIRYSYKYVNDTKKDIEGFEQGRTTHAFRYVFPFFYKEDYLGAVEISLSSHVLQNTLLNINKIHSHFLVKKDIFKVKAWDSNDLIQAYVQSIEHEDYMYTITKNSNQKILENNAKNITIPLKKEIAYNMNSNKPFALFTNVENTAKVITFLPIKDTQNKIAAYLVSYTDNDNIYNINTTYKYLNIIIFMGMIIVLYFLYKNLEHKRKLIEEVNNKTKDLQSLNMDLENKIKQAVDKNNEIQENLHQSQTMVAMSEMIMNISHQWRQPLSVISTAATGIELQKKYGDLTDDLLIYFSKTINNNAQYLGKILDSFNDLIRGDRERKIYNLKEKINDFIKIVETPIRMEQINLNLDIERDITVNGYPIELIECLHNLFDNSIDILKKRKSYDEKLVFISSSMENNNVIIKIKDNGGGISEKVLPKIFEPYFTTKHRSQGTGLGLHLTYKLIVDNMKGSLDVNNVYYKYEGKEYSGAEFIISLPID